MSTPQVRVGFSNARGVLGLFSRAIRTVTGGKVSHVWLLYYDADFGCDMVMEASTEWRLIPFAYFKQRNSVVRIFAPRIDIDHGLHVGANYLGSRYDAAGMLGNLVPIIGSWLRRKWANPFRSNRTVFCSEGVARVLLAAGYPGLVGSVHEIRPEMLLDLFEHDGSAVWVESDG